MYPKSVAALARPSLLLLVPSSQYAMHMFLFGSLQHLTCRLLALLLSGLPTSYSRLAVTVLPVPVSHIATSSVSNFQQFESLESLRNLLSRSKKQSHINAVEQVVCCSACQAPPMRRLRDPSSIYAILRPSPQFTRPKPPHHEPPPSFHLALPFSRTLHKYMGYTRD